MPLKTVKVPQDFEPLFARAEAAVAEYFEGLRRDPERGTIEVAGERYVLVRAAALSVEFFGLVRGLFGRGRKKEADGFSRNLLFDLAHSIGRADARCFHAKMGLNDPVERLSAGPIHFAHTGWAFVDIFPESNPSPDQDYYLIYDHPYSFEAKSWMESRSLSAFPVCIMNAGYSSGWCEESFGVPLVATEVLCRGRGDDCCRFIMAPPERIEERVEGYMEAMKNSPHFHKPYVIPGFFERKRTEEALRASEAWFRQVFDHMPSAVAIYKVVNNGADFVFTDFNQAAEHLEGMKRNEVVGQSVLKVFPGVKEFGLLEVFQRVWRTGRPERHPTSFYRDNRIAGWRENVVCKLPSGEVMAIYEDVTESKQAEEGLRESEQRLNKVVSAAQDAIIILDSQGRISLWNESAERIFGYSAEEVLGQDLHKLLAPGRFHDAYNRGIAEFHRSGRGNAVGRVLDLAALRKNGEEFPVEMSLSSMQLQGEWHAVGVVRDITERKRAEDELRASEERFRTLVTNIPGAVYRAACDADWTVEYVSAAAEAVTGYPAADFIGNRVRKWADIVHPDDHDWVEKAALEAMKQGESFDLTYRIIRADGDPRWVRHRGCGIRDAAGRLCWVDGVIFDVTARKRAEELERERDGLRQAVRGMEQVLGVIGHELRTPLAGVRAMAEVLLDTEIKETAEHDKFLKGIRDEMERMAQMVNDMLEVARLNSGTARWNWSRFSLADVCAGASSSIRPLVDGQRVAVSGEVRPPELMMQGDEAAVRRLILNLLSNAQKHTQEGQIQVSAVGSSGSDGAWVELAVSDTGTGMPPEAVEKLGEAFALNRGMVGDPFIKGSGLGLAICRGIVVAHGGSIEVQSALGRGTTVIVRLRTDLSEPVFVDQPIDIVKRIRDEHGAGCR